MAPGGFGFELSRFEAIFWVVDWHACHVASGQVDERAGAPATEPHLALAVEQ